MCDIHPSDCLEIGVHGDVMGVVAETLGQRWTHGTQVLNRRHGPDHHKQTKAPRIMPLSSPSLPMCLCGCVYCCRTRRCPRRRWSCGRWATGRRPPMRPGRSQHRPSHRRPSGTRWNTDAGSPGAAWTTCTQHSQCKRNKRRCGCRRRQTDGWTDGCLIPPLPTMPVCPCPQLSCIRRPWYIFLFQSHAGRFTQH